jgi:hypothetical protein
MAAAIRQQHREDERVAKVKQKREESMAALNMEFDEEVRAIRDIQRGLQFKQKVMARLVLELFSSIVIESAWRKYVAKKKLLLLKAKRLIKDWFRYFHHYRIPRRRAAARLVPWYRYRRSAHLFTVVEKVNSAMRRIVGWYRGRQRSICLRRRLDILAFRRRLVDRAVVFGATRAAHKIRKMAIDASERSPRRLAACGVLMRFFRRVLLSRRAQILHVYLYCQSFQTFDMRRYLERSKPPPRQPKPPADGAPEAHGQGHGGRRGSSSVVASATRRGSSTAGSPRRDDKDKQHRHQQQPVVENEKDGVIPARAAYLAFPEVIMFILSRLTAAHQVSKARKKRQQSMVSVAKENSSQYASSDTFLTSLTELQHGGDSEGREREGGNGDGDDDGTYTDKVFEYLLNARTKFYADVKSDAERAHAQWLADKKRGEEREQHEKMQTQLQSEMKSQMQMHHMLSGTRPAAATTTATATAADATTTTTGAHTSASSAVDTAAAAPVNTKMWDRSGLQESMRARLVAESLEMCKKTTAAAAASQAHGAHRRRSATANSHVSPAPAAPAHHRRPSVATSTTAGAGKAGSDEPMYDREGVPPLPREFLGIYQPRSFAEIVSLVWELRSMVIGMPQDVFDRIVGGSPPSHVAANGGAHEEEDNKESNNARYHQHHSHNKSQHSSSSSSFVPRLAPGVPTQRAAIQYLFFVSTEHLAPTSRSRLLEVFERRVDVYRVHERARNRELEAAAAALKAAEEAETEAAAAADSHGSTSKGKGRGARGEIKQQQQVANRARSGSPRSKVSASTTTVSNSTCDAPSLSSFSSPLSSDFVAVPPPRDPISALELRFFSSVTRAKMAQAGHEKQLWQQQQHQHMGLPQGQALLPHTGTWYYRTNVGYYGDNDLYNDGYKGGDWPYLAHYSTPDVRRNTLFWKSDPRMAHKLAPLPLAVEVLAPRVFLLRNKVPQTSSPTKAAAVAASPATAKDTAAAVNAAAKKRVAQEEKERRARVQERRRMAAEEKRSLVVERSLRWAYERRTAAAAAIIAAEATYDKMVTGLVTNVVVNGAVAGALEGAGLRLSIERAKREAESALQEERENRRLAELELAQRRLLDEADSSDKDEEDSSDGDEESSSEEEDEEEGEGEGEDEHPQEQEHEQEQEQEPGIAKGPSALFSLELADTDPAAAFLNEAKRMGALASHLLPVNVSPTSKDGQGKKAVMWQDQGHDEDEEDDEEEEEETQSLAPVKEEEEGQEEDVEVETKPAVKTKRKAEVDSSGDEEEGDEDDEEGESEGDESSQASSPSPSPAFAATPGSALEGGGSVEFLVPGQAPMFHSLLLNGSISAPLSLEGASLPAAASGSGSASASAQAIPHPQPYYYSPEDVSTPQNSSRPPSIVLQASSASNQAATHRPGKVAPLTPQMRSFVHDYGSNSSSQEGSMEQLVRSGGHSSPLHSQDIHVAAESLAHAVRSHKELPEGSYNSDFTRRLALSLKVSKAALGSISQLQEAEKTEARRKNKEEAAREAAGAASYAAAHAAAAAAAAKENEEADDISVLTNDDNESHQSKPLLTMSDMEVDTEAIKKEKAVAKAKRNIMATAMGRIAAGQRIGNSSDKSSSKSKIKDSAKAAANVYGGGGGGGGKKKLATIARMLPRAATTGTAGGTGLLAKTPSKAKGVLARTPSKVGDVSNKKNSNNGSSKAGTTSGSGSSTPRGSATAKAKPVAAAGPSTPRGGPSANPNPHRVSKRATAATAAPSTPIQATAPPSPSKGTAANTNVNASAKKKQGSLVSASILDVPAAKENNNNASNKITTKRKPSAPSDAKPSTYTPRGGWQSKLSKIAAVPGQSPRKNQASEGMRIPSFKAKK